MKDYQSFRQATYTQYIWVDVVILAFIFILVFYGVEALLNWLLPDSFNGYLPLWSKAIMLFILIIPGYAIDTMRLYQGQRELRFFNFYNIPPYKRIPLGQIEVLLVYADKKWRRYNLMIVVKSGKKYRLSIADYQTFVDVLLQYNPQIVVRVFN